VFTQRTACPSDAAVVHEGRIAIVAMRAYEGDPEMGEWLAQNKRFIPAW
jgi:hypothetical protein